MRKRIELRIPAEHFRVLPTPHSRAAKIGLFYARASDIPGELWAWRDVNPREVNQKSSLWRDISETLTDEPERFLERNRGLTITADCVEYDKDSQSVVITLVDPTLHGLVDGGHTLSAVLAAKDAPLEDDWPAFVFIKVMTGIDSGQIAEIAGGLNKSQQVDLKSLENLKKNFEPLRNALSGKPYADKIAYKMNEDKPIDVREVLYYLAIFDCETYNDDRHPTQLFGRKEGIVRKFADQADKVPGAGNSFSILFSHAPEILELRDRVELEALKIDGIGKYKAGRHERVRSKKHQQNDLHFLAATVDGKIPLGWLMPMLGGFRANVVWNAPAGSFSWRVPNEELLDACLPALAAGITEIHQRENSRPEYVGRSATAWRICYDRVRTAILEFEIARIQRGPVSSERRKRAASEATERGASAAAL